MRQKLLVIGGVVQVLLALLHIGMFLAPLPQSARPMAYVFNACVTAVVLFFAYVSLFKRRELVETAMGRVVCWFMALFYLQTVLVRVATSGRLLDDPFKLGLLLPTALLYAFAAGPSSTRRALLAVGGILQITLAEVHVVAFLGVVAGGQVPAKLARTFYGFDAAAVAVILFLAYVSLFQSDKLVSTPMGRRVCWFAALFLLQRAVVGIVAPGFDEVGLAALLVPQALLYGFVAAPAWPRPASKAARVAEAPSAA